MANETTIYVKRVLDNKYEIVSRDLNLKQGRYTIQNIDGLWIMKHIGSPNFYKNRELQTKDFFVFDNANQANKFAYSQKEKIENQELIGIKGFNNKFYFFASTYYNENKKKILDLLTQEGTSLEEISARIGINEEILRGIIELMKEEGLIFEKTKGILFKI